jgi:hypothetical protein
MNDNVIWNELDRRRARRERIQSKIIWKGLAYVPIPGDTELESVMAWSVEMAVTMHAATFRYHLADAKLEVNCFLPLPNMINYIGSMMPADVHILEESYSTGNPEYFIQAYPQRNKIPEQIVYVTYATDVYGVRGPEPFRVPQNDSVVIQIYQITGRENENR